MKSRPTALVMSAFVALSMTLASCSSGSSTDTTIAASDMSTDSVASKEMPATDTPSDEMAVTDDMSGASAYCTNAMPLKALDLKNVTSDTAGGAAMALDAVMGEFSDSLQESSASMQQFLMEAATSTSAKDGSSHQATLTEVLKWFDERC